jgi:PhnB protein
MPSPCTGRPVDFLAGRSTPEQDESKGDRMQIHAYVFFNGRCEEAIEHYRNALGAQVQTLMRFKESPDPAPPGMLPPGWEPKVMHAELRIGDTMVMVSDGHSADQPAARGFSLVLSVPDVATADRIFAALAAGGQIQMPLGQTFWSPRFGMVIDRFGVAWMVNVVPTS